MLRGLMQQVPLTLNMVRERVGELFPDKPVITRFQHGLHTVSYREVVARAGQLAGALRQSGVERGTRVATLAWNSHRHLELYLAVPCMGAVLHTINPRLSPSDIGKLLLHAEDKFLFVDRSIWKTLRSERALLDASVRIVVMEDEPAGTGDAQAGSTLLYEDFIGSHPADFSWPLLDENEAAGLCYTSGTTGEPKGVLYSHRSTTLHTMSCLFADGIAMRERDVCMPAVPMFHANAWGFPYAAMMAGAALALPSRQTDPASLIELVEAAGVTMATAVPMVWSGVLDHVKTHPESLSRIRSLKRLPLGGTAVSPALIEGFADLGIDVMHCWGMTEISPLGLTNVTRSDLTEEQKLESRSAQGIPIPGCSFRIVGPAGERLAHDGSAPGELQISSPWVASDYYAGGSGNADARHAGAFVAQEGRRWLRTGDVATIDAHGYVRIVDRAKDMIKSGGEWISSQALELHLSGHPDVAEAAIVGRPDEKWQERPVACISLKKDTAEFRTAFQDRFAGYMLKAFPRWQIPDDVFFLASLPKGSTGKVDKMALRRIVTAA